MPTLPDWAPNIHPMLVHFPLALLFTAVLFDLLGVLFKKQVRLREIADFLFVVGAISAVFTYFSGKQASDIVTLPALANPTLNEHSDLALWTMLYFGIYAIARTFLILKKLHTKKMVSWILLLSGAAGLILLFETGEHGAELVFKYGVGVQAMQSIEVAKNEITKEEIEVKNLEFSENGPWSWHPDPGAKKVLAEQFHWLTGAFENLSAEVISDSIRGDFLSLRPTGQPLLFVAGDSLESVQVDVLLNVDDFAGSIMLLHHVQDDSNYDFFSLQNGIVQLGRVSGGKTKVFDKGKTAANGWISLRVVGDGRHFRGYINNKERVTHGHANALPPGRVGIRVHGIGTLFLGKMSVQSLL